MESVMRSPASSRRRRARCESRAPEPSRPDQISREDLAAYGVAFISLRHNLDLSTPSGRLMMHIIGAMAEFERELIRERVSAGIQAAKRRGVRIGRPRTYVSPQKVRAMRDEGLPWRTIAKRLNVGTGTAVRAFATGHLTQEEN